MFFAKMYESCIICQHISKLQNCSFTASQTNFIFRDLFDCTQNCICTCSLISYEIKIQIEHLYLNGTKDSTQLADLERATVKWPARSGTNTITGNKHELD